MRRMRVSNGIPKRSIQLRNNGGEPIWQADRGGLTLEGQFRLQRMTLSPKRKKDPGVPQDNQLLEPKNKKRYSLAKLCFWELRRSKYTKE